VKIVALGPGDEAKVRQASRLFDRPARDDAASRFLNDPNHHLLVAYEGDVPAGFVSGVELTHPDKGTEMFLYELGVDEPFRRRGIGRALVTALADLARGRGCYGMFVLTDDGNPAALATYQAAGGVPDDADDRLVMLNWDALS
jgi:[ribosomal protein S18]-alanine N-acetyltransferase